MVKKQICYIEREGLGERIKNDHCLGVQTGRYTKINRVCFCGGVKLTNYSVLMIQYLTN